jgi:multiple sugar transport system substrate-binding protein
MNKRAQRVVAFVLIVATILMALPAAAQEDFNWRQFEGQKITVFLTEVAMSQGIRQNLQEFIDRTGIEVEYLVVAEAQYWDKLNVDLSSGAGEYDVFMSGASFCWGWSEAGWIEPLDPFIEDPALTPVEWDFADFYPWAIAAQRWDGTPGPEGLGQGDLWSLPVNAETTLLTYRKDLLDEWGLECRRPGKNGPRPLARSRN